MPRDGSEVRYVDLDTHFCFHFANGYEVDQTLVLDCVRTPSLELGNASQERRPLWEAMDLETLRPNRFTRYEALLCHRSRACPRCLGSHEATCGLRFWPPDRVYGPLSEAGAVGSAPGLPEHQPGREHKALPLRLVRRGPLEAFGRLVFEAVSALDGKTGPLQGLAKVDVTGEELQEIWMPRGPTFHTCF